MEKGGLTRSACLIVLMGTMAIAMIGFAAWRYEVALSRASVALSDRADAATAQALTAAFWHERQAVGAYMVAPGPAALGAAAAQHDQFHRLATQLARAGLGAGAPSLAQAVAANTHYYSVFVQARAAAGTAAAQRVTAGQLEPAAGLVVPPLDTLGRSTALRAAAAQAAATSVAGQSRAVGIATVLVTIAIGNALGSF